MGVRERGGPPRVLPDTELPHLPPRRTAGRVREPIERERSAGTFFSVQNDQKRAGCTVTRTRVSGETEVGGRPAGAFEALLELLSVNPQLSGNREAHATGLVIFHSDRSGRSVEANGGKKRQRSGAVRVELREDRGRTQLAAQAASDLQIQRRQMEVACVHDLRADGRGRRRVGLRRPRQDRVV